MRRQYNLALLRNQPLEYLVRIDAIVQQYLHRTPYAILDHGKRADILVHALLRGLFVQTHETHAMVDLRRVDEVESDAERLHDAELVSGGDVVRQLLHNLDGFDVVRIRRAVHAVLAKARVQLVHGGVLLLDHLGQHVR